jgi:serine/threonine protein kinase
LPRSINPSIPVQVEEVLLKALEKNPKDRYQSGKSLMTALRKALKASPTKSQPVAVLPPIPVNAPTIQRSEVSLNSFTKRDDVISALEKQTTTRHPVIEEELALRSDKRKSGWVLVLALLLLAFLGYTGYRSGIVGDWLSAQAAPTTISQQTELAIPLLLTDTSSPIPTDTLVPITKTVTATSTKTMEATRTNTASPSATSTAIPMIPTITTTAFPTVVTSTATPNVTGYPMTAYYNENSFYILNKGQASRSASGFVFERIDRNGVIQQRFEGWRWEENIKNIFIAPNRCLSLEIYLSLDPYLSPPECENRTSSRLSLPMSSGDLFWTPSDNSDQFRILWLNEEIARCEIEAGTCDFYVP